MSNKSPSVFARVKFFRLGPLKSRRLAGASGICTSREPSSPEQTVISFCHLWWSSTFFRGGNFQMMRTKKWVLMSAHHISVTFSSLLKLWCKCDSYIFLPNHIIITFLSQCCENVFSQNFVVNLWFTFPSHFYHNVRKMSWLTFCDGNVMQK